MSSGTSAGARRLVELNAPYARGDGEIPLTQEQLAELAGTSRATVNKVLREKQERTVELRRGKTLVLQADELARASAERPKRPASASFLAPAGR